jgi:S1-C subfamily serine protease
MAQHHTRLGHAVAIAVAVVAASARGDVEPSVLAAEARRVEVIRRGTATAVSIFAGDGGGSGVLVSPTGYALTNFHVVQPAGPALRCGLADGRLYDAVIVGLDPTGDVALVKLLGRDDFPHAVLADSEAVRPGDTCFVAGNPFLLATDLVPSVSVGIVSAVHRYQFPAGTILEYTDCLQVDAAINPGNSGGGLFDATGRVIGLVGRASFEKRGRVNVGAGYAVSANQLRHFIGCLRGGRLVDHATLGATVGSAADGRVVVSDILESSDAWRRGLRYDDEIVSLAGRTVRTVNAFKNVLGTLPAGWQVPLVFRRDGRRLEALVRLAPVHAPAELAELAGFPPGDAATSPTALPTAVAGVYEPRPGFVNHHFNVVERDRVARALAAGRPALAAWTLEGADDDGGRYRIALDDDGGAIELSTGTTAVAAAGPLDGESGPPGSGGLLAALVLWHRLVRAGPAALGSTIYWGTAPRDAAAWTGGAEAALVDVLESAVAGVTARFGVDDDGRVVWIDLWTEPDGEPCEVRFGPPAADGLPTGFVVGHGGTTFGTFARDDGAGQGTSP